MSKRPAKQFLSVSIIILILGITALQSACKKTDSEQVTEDKIEIALGFFVGELQVEMPDSAALSERVRSYLSSNSDDYFGATVALVDSSGTAWYSPYWYRTTSGLAMKNLADTTYHINEQDWLTEPLAQGKAVWTEPYFDAGGGEIWMKTLSIPVIINEVIVAVATTDMRVPEP